MRWLAACLVCVLMGCATGRRTADPELPPRPPFLVSEASTTLPQPANFLDPCRCEPVDRPAYIQAPTIEAWADHDIYAAMRSATAKIKPWFDSGRLAYRKNAHDWSALEPQKIEVNFQACDFFVPGAKFYGNVCAAGMGDGNYRDMFISTRVWSRIPALVEWEMGNVILRYFGRDDWTDIWNRLAPDPGWTPAPPKRRSAGH